MRRLKNTRRKYKWTKAITTYHKTRKTTRPKKVDNGASARPPNLTSASCDLDLWPLTSWPQTWSFHTLGTPTTCTNLHQNRFIYFQNIVFTSLLTDERTDGRVENVMAPASITKTSRSYTVHIKNSQYNLLASEHKTLRLSWQRWLIFGKSLSMKLSTAKLLRQSAGRTNQL